MTGFQPFLAIEGRNGREGIWVAVDKYVVGKVANRTAAERRGIMITVAGY